MWAIVWVKCFWLICHKPGLCGETDCGPGGLVCIVVVRSRLDLWCERIRPAAQGYTHAAAIEELAWAFQLWSAGAMGGNHRYEIKVKQFTSDEWPESHLQPVKKWLQLRGEQINWLNNLADRLLFVCVCVDTCICIYDDGYYIYLCVCACRSKPTLRTPQTTTSASPRGSRWRSTCLPPSPPNRYSSHSSSSSCMPACLFLYGWVLFCQPSLSGLFFIGLIFDLVNSLSILFTTSPLYNFLQSFFQNAEPLSIKHLIVTLIWDNYSPANCYMQLLWWWTFSYFYLIYTKYILASKSSQGKIS